ncbi:MAG: hypothetical protein LH614_14315 [Pyrinomonadaceae bacterium]|nr:hypothetical protein [Pyrinomonadaceae bacterium]
MKKISLHIFAVVIISAFAFQSATAQFQIKIPKFNKPKVEQPKPSETPTAPGNAKSNDNRPAQSQSEPLDDPKPGEVPQLLLETLEIKAKNESQYWKTPNQNNNPSWFPQVSFELFYNFAGKTTRFTAEWFNADGSLWFSEGLEKYDSTILRSPYESVQFNKNAVQATGTYGLKITDTKTGKVHFQGKFKIVKQSLNPNETPKHIYFVDNDWHLPVAYVGFLRNWTDYNLRPRPRVFFWFKGVLDGSQFEAELHYNNQKINTTDKGGNINKHAQRGEECFLAREVCAFSLYGFEWDNFLLDNSPNVRSNNPNAYFTKDKPGEYTVKIFYKGDQVREAKFTIDQKGLVARNAFSEQIFLNDYRVAVPVKVIGNMEKWNATTWKTDAFYGNPLAGFNIP